MIDYLALIVLFDVIALFLIGVITSQNQLITKKERHKFQLTYLFVAIVSISELFAVKVNGMYIQLRMVNVVLSASGFILAPLIPIMLGSAICPDTKEKIMKRMWMLYAATVILSIPFGGVFYIDQHNMYSRGPLFLFFILIYWISCVYYMVMMVCASKKYYRKSSKIIILLALFFFIESSIQVMNPSIQLSWMAVTLLVIINYIYFNTLWQQIDGLTGLLNQQSYLYASENNKNNGVMIFMDIDKFKQINDTYGHLVGNEILMKISQVIKDVYSAHGNCYRVGGDEFLVIVNEKTDYKSLNDKFYDEVEQLRKSTTVFPDVSVGCMPFTSQDDLNLIFEKADHEMYLDKQN